MAELDTYTCPECDGEMLTESPDRHCIECVHEGCV